MFKTLFTKTADRALGIKPQEPAAVVPKNTKKALTVVPSSVYEARRDIKDWKIAKDIAADAKEPDSTGLIAVYKDIELDNTLSSQIRNRVNDVLATPFQIIRNNKPDEELTNLVKGSLWFNELNAIILRSVYYGYSLADLQIKNGELIVEAVSDYNLEPMKGWFFVDASDRDKNKAVPYRELREYGVTLLDFGTVYTDALLNKAVPSALFKKFAMSCWSELCEIYGIPPRVLKTDTADPQMLKQSETMMKSMGAAAWMVIDKEDQFEFAQGATTNGDVYRNFIALCNSEMSLLITGAVLGQDTQNGSRAKDEVALEVFEKMVCSDLKEIERQWQSKVMSALVKLGILPEGCVLKFEPVENLTQLWQIVNEGMKNGLTADVEWVNSRFGTKFIGYKA